MAHFTLLHWANEKPFFWYFVQGYFYINSHQRKNEKNYWEKIWKVPIKSLNISGWKTNIIGKKKLFFSMKNVLFTWNEPISIYYNFSNWQIQKIGKNKKIWKKKWIMRNQKEYFSEELKIIMDSKNFYINATWTKMVIFLDSIPKIQFLFNLYILKYSTIEYRIKKMNILCS